MSAAIYVTLYERLLALAVSVALALAGAVYLFGLFAVDLKRGGNDFILLTAGVGSAVVASALLAWGAEARQGLKGLDAAVCRRIARNLSITLAIHLFTMMSFVVMAGALGPPTSLLKLAAASAIVMFAASLPISMAGWGMRELTAVFALGALGFPPAISVAAGVLLGLMALATNGLVAFAVMTSGRPPERKADAAAAFNLCPVARASADNKAVCGIALPTRQKRRPNLTR